MIDGCPECVVYKLHNEELDGILDDPNITDKLLACDAIHLSGADINNSHYFDKYKKALEDFEGYLEDLYKCCRGIELPQGQAPTSTFWLVHNNEVVGVVRVRHQETEETGHIGYDISPIYRNKGYGTQILRLASENTLKLLKARTDKEEKMLYPLT